MSFAELLPGLLIFQYPDHEFKEFFRFLEISIQHGRNAGEVQRILTNLTGYIVDASKDKNTKEYDNFFLQNMFFSE